MSQALDDALLAAVAAPSARPSAAELQSRLANILPNIRARAEATERDRTVPRASIEALRGAGLLKVVQPRAFGGYEHDFDVLVGLVYETAKACASTGWVFGLYAAHQWLVASFAAEAQRDVWDLQPDAAICGSYAPAGEATLEPGGFRLSGRWEFASGCDAADWALCASMLPSRIEGLASAPAFLLVASADCMIDDTWNVAGLAGSGSKTLVLNDVFVPQHRVLTFREAITGETSGLKLYSNPGFRLPLLTTIPSCLAATAVGAAAGALDTYLDMAGRRITRGAIAGSNNRMAEFPTIQLRVAEASASVNAAIEILLSDLRRCAQIVRVDADVTVEDRITSRRGQAFSVLLAIRAAEALNSSTGCQGLVLTNPIQRAWRDVNAIGRHISLNWDAVGTMYGQMALGLEPRGQY